MTPDLAFTWHISVEGLQSVDCVQTCVKPVGHVLVVSHVYMSVAGLVPV